MEPTDFCELVERLRGGESTAVQHFVARYEQVLRREVRFLLLDSRLRHLASESDICQSVLARFFVGLWAGKYEFRRPEELIGLLKKMVRSRMTDLARYWTAQRRDVRRNVFQGSRADMYGPGGSQTPSQLVANAELLEEVKERLTERERLILRLRQERVCWAEIAERLDRQGQAEAIRKQYERALARVSRQLGIDDA